MCFFVRRFESAQYRVARMGDGMNPEPGHFSHGVSAGDFLTDDNLP